MGSTGLKVFATGTAAAVTGLTALGTTAVKTYADYEQLVGGVETLFGAGGKSIEQYAISVGKSIKEVADVEGEFNELMLSQNKVLENASAAYETAGLSANEYMESVTGIAAALKQSTSSEMEAALAADQAIIDMADNANKMGTSMESIQNAYQGFAKQNYTMLDNLKLGYGGTKEEMNRLLQDATAISGVEYDLSNLSDVYEAIHVIQTELGITGTTAKEASTTISGSANAMKASWQNLLVGIADDSQDFDVLIDNFVESAVTFGDNILPRVEDVLVGTGNLVEKLLPVIVDRIPDILDSILPNLIISGMNMVTTLINGVEANLPTIVNAVILILQQFTDTFLSLLPQLLEIGLFIILQLALGITSALPEMVPQIVDVMLTIIQVLIDNVGLLVDASIQIIMALAQGLINSLPMLIERVPEIIIAIWDALIENGPKLLEAAYELIVVLAEGLITYLPSLLSKIPGLVTTVLNKFIELVSCFDQVGASIIDGIWKGLSAGWNWLVGKVKELANSLFGAAKEELEVNSPSKKFEWLADMCIAGWDNKMDNFMDPTNMTRNIRASLGVMKNNIAGASMPSAASGLGNMYQNIYVNKEVSTADELARAIRVESRYGMMRGVPVG